jgi:proline iminopeptidase
MAVVETNGITLEYESMGRRKAPAIVLIMGLGMQSIDWPDPFCRGLVAKGFRVIRFDNRDSGMSSRISAQSMDLAFAFSMSWMGMPISTPYTLRDMAADTIGLMDALDIERAHVVGASLGGMIAQTLATDHADRVRSLTSVMSSTGNLAVSQGRLKAMLALMVRPKDPKDKECVIDALTDAYAVLSSPSYPTSREDLRTQISRAVGRGYTFSGTKRQMLAAIAAGDRRHRLRGVAVPTLVIHGEDDPLMPVSAGRDTARCIPGAELLTIPGMGHDLPAELVPHFVEHIADFCRRTDGRHK